MLRKLDQRLPDLLLKPKYRFMRHALILWVIGLITVSILWDEPVRVLPGRFGAWGIYFALFSAITYLNMYVLVPRLLLRGKANRYVLITVSVVVCFIFSLGMLQGGTENSPHEIRTPAVIGIVSSIGAFSLFIVGLTALQLFKYQLENERQISALKGATMAIELANLQNQINPHFLFNMLNNANIMASEDADKSADMLARLNQLLRYQVANGSKDSVGLREDIAFFTDYLELEKIRRDRFGYTIQTTGNLDVEVPPLLFIPFIENAVKHNPENDAYVSIVFKVTARRLYFECSNPKAESPLPKKEGGIGLANVKRRLDLLFGNNYTLHLNDEEAAYTVVMEVML